MADPEFLTPEGERAWTWLRRHLDRANSFWLAFLLTDDLAAQRVLRERVRANRRARAHPLTVLEPPPPVDRAGLPHELEARGAAPPGCTWVAAARLADKDWLAAWRVFLLTVNHRRDVLRARLGGLVIAAPPAVKEWTQRESPDLWSVRDLLIELAPRPVITGDVIGRDKLDEPHQSGHSSQGLSYDSADADLAQEAQVLLAMPVAELAGPARERVSRAVHRAVARGENQLAAVLLLAQSDGYQAAGDPAGALHLPQEGLTLDGVEPRTRERLLDSGVKLATTISELELARHYAAESVALTEQRVSMEDPDTQRDSTTAHIHHQQALSIYRRLAQRLGTVQALRDLRAGLKNLARTEEELGNADAAAALRAELAIVADRLATLSDDPSNPPDHPATNPR